MSKVGARRCLAHTVHGAGRMDGRGAAASADNAAPACVNALTSSISLHTYYNLPPRHQSMY